MRFHNSLDGILSQQSKVKVLRYLANQHAEFTGREIARSVGLSHTITHTVLDSLYNEGVVLMRKFGRSIQWHIWWGH